MSDPIRDDSTRAFAEQFPLPPVSMCSRGDERLWNERQKVATLVSAIDRIEAATVERNAAIDAAIALAERYRVDPPNANSGHAAGIKGQG